VFVAQGKRRRAESTILESESLIKALQQQTELDQKSLTEIIQVSQALHCCCHMNCALSKMDTWAHVVELLLAGLAFLSVLLHHAGPVNSLELAAAAALLQSPTYGSCSLNLQLWLLPSLHLLPLLTSDAAPAYTVSSCSCVAHTLSFNVPEGA
jgi:hypothetical protein